MEININAGKNALTGLEQQDQFRSITLGNTENSINIHFSRVEFDLTGKPYKPNTAPSVMADMDRVSVNGGEVGHISNVLTEAQVLANKEVLEEIRLQILTLLETELPKLKL